MPVNAIVRDADPNSQQALDALRHSCAHVMAQAVQELFPGTKLTIGPAIENGFYYDFDSEHRFSEDDFLKIEKRMGGPNICSISNDCIVPIEPIRNTMRRPGARMGRVMRHTVTNVLAPLMRAISSSDEFIVRNNGTSNTILMAMAVCARCTQMMPAKVLMSNAGWRTKGSTDSAAFMIP